MTDRYLVVGFDGRHHAIRFDAVREIVRPETITRVPAAPAAVRGVTAIRGRIVPVLHAGDPATSGPGALVVVVAAAGRSLGLAVDRIGEILGGGTGDLPVLDVDRLVEAG